MNHYETLLTIINHYEPLLTIMKHRNRQGKLQDHLIQ